jgi:hypothetical protein
MSMTKFTGENDLGYVRVRDTLWLWISDEKNKNGERIRDGSRSSEHAGYGPIHSGGGNVFIGSNNAGRDVTNIYLGQDEGERDWSDILKAREMDGRCRNCGLRDHWERDCPSEECGKCESSIKGERTQ